MEPREPNCYELPLHDFKNSLTRISLSTDSDYITIKVYHHSTHIKRFDPARLSSSITHLLLSLFPSDCFARYQGKPRYTNRKRIKTKPLVKQSKPFHGVIPYGFTNPYPTYLIADTSFPRCNSVGHLTMVTFSRHLVLFASGRMANRSLCPVPHLFDSLTQLQMQP